MAIKVFLFKEAGHDTKSVVSRILLETGIDAELSYLNDGKPVLTNGYFVSVSHSHGLLSIALSSEPIGIDVEKKREIKYAPLLRRLGEADRDLIGFLSLWTRAESVFKAEGGSIESYKTTSLLTETYATGEYILSLSYPNNVRSVDFLGDMELCSNIVRLS